MLQHLVSSYRLVNLDEQCAYPASVEPEQTPTPQDPMDDGLRSEPRHAERIV